MFSKAYTFVYSRINDDPQPTTNKHRDSNNIIMFI